MIKSSLGIAVWKDLYTAYTRKIISKKLRYFRLPPNLAHRKWIDVTNYVACSTEPPIGSFTQCNDFCCGYFAFAKSESLYQRITTKYKSSKLFWRILEDNKPKNANIEVRKQ